MVTITTPNETLEEDKAFDVLKENMVTQALNTFNVYEVLKGFHGNASQILLTYSEKRSSMHR